jgi:hypothetical protein
MGISISGGSDRQIIEEMGTKTIQAIDKLNKSTTRLNWIMIWLTIVLVFLTSALVRLTVILIKR